MDGVVDDNNSNGKQNQPHKTKGVKTMRKINNLTDWTNFIGDARHSANGSDVYFAVSKTGEEWDGQAKIEYRSASYFVDDFWSYLSWSDVASEKKDMSPREFYDDVVELLGVESFYIVDTGANYNWL